MKITVVFEGPREWLEWLYEEFRKSTTTKYKINSITKGDLSDKIDKIEKECYEFSHSIDDILSSGEND